MKGFLFFDIDKTLVDSPRTHEISENTRQALKAARANGYGCFIASGRNRKGIEQYMNDDFDGFVFADGAGVELKGQDPLYFPLSKELVKQLRHVVKEQYGGSICPWSADWAYADDAIYETFRSWTKVSADSPDEEEKMEAAGIRHLWQWDEEETIISCDVEFPSEKEEEDFMRTLDPRLEYISTSASYGRGGICTGEVTADGITKGKGAEQIVAMLGGDMKDTYAFGDSMNDAMLLKTVRYGICMGNGAEELKAIADYVTKDINDNGIEAALKHFGII